MRTDLRRGLTQAIKGKDRIAISAIRSALAAIDNAEAPSVEHHATTSIAVGVGSTEVERLHLTDADLHAIVDEEVQQRAKAAEEYERLGRAEQAERLRAEADVLRRYL
ncbi:GatB/YqeY domain-containing protein [Amycolatopsis magusensis]|uniref:GatB/YqeY domain-containing protein n=1 Tax=Amycolatopsis magusensis TaxID=882444 RepID=UPI003C2DF746